MPEPYIGHIMPVAFDFAPRGGWLLCQGQILPIAQYQALFAVLRTTHGGDGRTTFALPDLRGRVPLGAGNGPGLTPRALGAKVGSESVTLTLNQLPSHTHELRAATAAGSASLGGAPALAASPADAPPAYAPGNSPPIPAEVGTGANDGGAPHENRQPFVTINHIICVSGIFPSRAD